MKIQLLFIFFLLFQLGHSNTVTFKKDSIDYYFEELKYEEISKKLNLPLGTVKVRLRRAKDFLAKLLEGHKDKY